MQDINTELTTVEETTIKPEMEPFAKLQKYVCACCKEDILDGDALVLDTIDDKPVALVHTGCLKDIEALRNISDLSRTLAYLKKHDNTEECPPNQLVTLNEWLKAEKIEIEKGDKHRLATLAAKLYAQKTGKKPREVIRPLDSGRYANRSKGYNPNHLDILKEAYDQIKAG